MVRKRSNVAQTLRPSFLLSTLGSRESSRLKVTAWAAAARLNSAKEFEGANVWTGRTVQNVTAFCCMQSASTHFGIDRLSARLERCCSEGSKPRLCSTGIEIATKIAGVGRSTADNAMGRHDSKNKIKQPFVLRLGTCGPAQKFLR
jgi:hypothetical protein